MLVNGETLLGVVQSKEYRYYKYYLDCDDCILMVSAGSFTAYGDPDLFVSFGEDDLPTREHNDFSSATYRNENLEINRKANNPHDANVSNRGYYVIGVFGRSNTTYWLQAQSMKYPIMRISQGLTRSITQGAKQEKNY